MKYYAKLTPLRFRILVSIYDTFDGVDRLLYTRKFIRFTKARSWAEGTVVYLAFKHEGRSFIHEDDITKRKYIW